jgi:hypothetical protein
LSNPTKWMASFLFFAPIGQISSSSVSGDIARVLLDSGAPYPVWRRERHAVSWRFILRQRPRES